MNIFTKINVGNCDECPLLARRETSVMCAVSERELPSDLTNAPSWCPARGGVTVKLSPLPSDYHRWTAPGESALSPKLCKEIVACLRCGLRRKSVRQWITENSERRSVWIWTYEVNGTWVTERPGCRSSKDSP